jgi:hypothetical protein
MALEREINVDELSIYGTLVTATAAQLNAVPATSSTVTELNYLDITTLGTGAASKAVVLDAGEDYTWPATGILTYGAGAINSTGAEITRACDVSARLVALTATAPITLAAHEGRDMYITGTAAATYTLPEATGSGSRFRFIMGQVNTNGTIITTVDATNCGFYGSVNILDKDAAAQGAYAAAATDELITLNGTSTGGQIGDFIELLDIATDKWMVFGQLTVPAGSNPATPFSGA